MTRAIYRKAKGELIRIVKKLAFLKLKSKLLF